MSQLRNRPRLRHAYQHHSAGRIAAGILFERKTFEEVEILPLQSPPRNRECARFRFREKDLRDPPIRTCRHRRPAARDHQRAARQTRCGGGRGQQYVTAELTRRHIPGVALAIVRGGKVIKAQGYGKADLEHEIPVTPETVFKIGSVSKQFLSTGIMVLAQDGRVSVDDPVASTSTACRSRGAASRCGTS